MQLKLFSTKIPARQPRKKSILHTRGGMPQRDLWNQSVETERHMALLFLDIRNFTPLADEIQATDIIHLMKKLLTVFQRIVRNHHGRIVDTTGDGFYAAFGFETSISDAINDATRAGRAILNYLDAMNNISFESSFHRKIEAGIGIHAGPVATGTIRIDGQDHVMVMGQAVNIASRLQETTKKLNNNFVMSDIAFQQLDHSPESLAIDVNLKGVKETITARLIGKAYAYDSRVVQHDIAYRMMA